MPDADAWARRSASPAPQHPAAPIAKAPKAYTVDVLDAQIASMEYQAEDQQWTVMCVARDAYDEVKYEFQLVYESANATDPTGTFTAADFNTSYTEITDYTSESPYIMVREASMTFTGDAQTGYTLTADLLTYDDITYHVEATRPPMPAVTNTMDLTATNLTFDETYFYWEGFVIARASTIKYSIDLQLYTAYGAYLNEEFTTGDLQRFSIKENLTTNEVLIEYAADAKISITDKDGKTAVTGYVLDWNGTKYNINLTYDVPEPKHTVNIDFTEPAILADNTGMFMWTAWISTADVDFPNAPEGYDNFGVYLGIITDNLPGTYTFSDVFSLWTMLGFIDTDGDQLDHMLDIADIRNIVVTYDEATGYHHLTAEIITRDEVQFNIKMRGYLGGLSYDAYDVPLDRTFTAQDTLDLWLYDYTEFYGLYAAHLDVYAPNDLMWILFNIETPVGPFHIPAGTYDINSSTEIGTVLASTGVNNAGQPTYSLYTTRNELYWEKSYFLQSGTVVVEYVDNALHVEIDAVNSYDLPVKISYTSAPATTLEQVAAEAEVHKILSPEGHLLILRGGHTYDATGTCVK